MNKPILIVDFDGCLHSYTSGWKGEAIVSDPPVKGAIKWLWKATEWFDVQIYSSRSKSEEGREAMFRWLVEHARVEFDEEHPMAFPEPAVRENYPIKFASEKPAAFLTIDDRAICFEGDWSDPELEPAGLLHFRPWNKRPLGASGTFPQGQLTDDDQGELTLGIAYDNLAGIVRVDFGKPVAWLGLPPPMAIQMAQSLLKAAAAKGMRG